jgi:hypothetical protein
MDNQDFPPLDDSKKLQYSYRNHIHKETRTDDTLDSTKALLLINQNLVEMRKNNSRIEGKLERIDSKLNQTALDTELHQITIAELIEHVRLLIQQIVRPVTSQIKPELLNFKTGLQYVYDKLHHLKKNLCNDYEVGRKLAVSPPIQDKLRTTSEEMMNDVT